MLLLIETVHLQKKMSANVTNVLTLGAVATVFAIGASVVFSSKHEDTTKKKHGQKKKKAKKREGSVCSACQHKT